MPPVPIYRICRSGRPTPSTTATTSSGSKT
jgi:hypothetical protein